MLFLCIAALLLVLSNIYDIRNYQKNKTQWYNIILLVLIFFAGLKYHLGGDNYSYLYYFYNIYPSLKDYTIDDFAVGRDPLYALINSLVKDYGGRFYIVQFIHATFLNVLIFRYFKKHSRYIFTCVFFYFITCYFHYNAEVLRASLAIVICLYGNDYIKEKKWIKGFILYGVALFCHAQTLLIFILPLLFRLKLDYRGYIILLVAFVFSFSIKNIFNNYLFVLDNMDNLQTKAEMYVDSDVYGSGSTSLGGLLVYLMPILYLFYSSHYLKKKGITDTLEFIEPFVFLGILFTIFSYNMPIFYRYTDYFRIYFVIIFTEFFVRLSASSYNFKNGYCLVKSVFFYIPFFFIITVSMLDKTAYIRYFPYTSIINKEIVQERERIFNDVGVKPSDY